MTAIGLDIGSTTVSAVLIDSENTLANARTAVHHATIPGAAYENLQDPAQLYDTAVSLLDEMIHSCKGPVSVIGITGQMHGILYLDSRGEPVSPLFTWQDGSGNLPFGSGSTYATELARISGYPVAAGYGIVTYYFHVKTGALPPDARYLCTIHDYLAMKLTGRTIPVTDGSDGASLGLFNLVSGRFDGDALERAGMNPAILPGFQESPVLGTYAGIPVCIPIGDNQASFIGATNGRSDGCLVNIGTGSQFSAFCPALMECPGLESRPFPGGGYLAVGAALCGGKAYALLERFFADIVKMATGEEVDCYEAMAKRLAQLNSPEKAARVQTTFCGTRLDPSLRGAFLGVSDENMTAGHFALGVLQGIADELHAMYNRYLAAGGSPAKVLFGSGNGLRKNPVLQKIVSDTFDLPLALSSMQEEAAWGAALYALNCIKAGQKGNQ